MIYVAARRAALRKPLSAIIGSRRCFLQHSRLTSRNLLCGRLWSRSFTSLVVIEFLIGRSYYTPKTARDSRHTREVFKLDFLENEASHENIIAFQCPVLCHFYTNAPSISSNSKHTACSADIQFTFVPFYSC